MESLITAFYKLPYSFDEIVFKWGDERWESTHDFIQILFPTNEPSSCCKDSPVLSEIDIEVFCNSNHMQEMLIIALKRFMDFINRSGKDIWIFPNHNWMRITRCLRSLTLLGCEYEAKYFLRWLEWKNIAYGSKIPEDTLTFWRNAVKAVPIAWEV